MSFNPFQAGEPLGSSSAIKVAPVARRVFTVFAQAADAGAANAFPEEIAKIGNVEVPKPTMGRVKIGIYFTTWWALNVVFNIYNKKVLNVFHFPWLTSTLSLLAGSTIMLLSWALRIVPALDVDVDFWKGLAPVRWTSAACPLLHAAPSCPSIHAASFSSAASPSVGGKPGVPGGSTDDAVTVATSEEKAEPIKPPFTGDAKGGTGLGKIMSGLGQGE